MHPQTVPANPVWPFVKTGAPQSLPWKATCLDGAIVNIPVHAFAKDRIVGGITVETAEDHAGRIGGLIEGILDGYRVELNGGLQRIHITLTDMNLLMDSGEPGAFHYYANCQAKVIA